MRYLASDPGVRERLAALPLPEVIIDLAEAGARLTEVAAAQRTPWAEPAATGESERTGLAARQLRRIRRALGDGPAR